MPYVNILECYMLMSWERYFSFGRYINFHLFIYLDIGKNFKMMDSDALEKSYTTDTCRNCPDLRAFFMVT